MEYPTRQEYNMAVEHLDRFVLVPHLKGGRPKRTKRNTLYGLFWWLLSRLSD